MKARPFPPAHPHGEIVEVLPDLFQVSGTCVFASPVPMRFSRVMTVQRLGERLVLWNTIRLDDGGLAALDRLGKVDTVVRLAGNHGADDPFYKDRYGATVWAPEGAPYMPGFDVSAEPYFEPDRRYGSGESLPIEGAKVHLFRSSPTEALVVLPQAGGVALSGDSLQNWSAPDRYFNWLGKWSMRMMGFFRPHNVGPGWLRQCRPPAEDLLSVLDLSWEHLLPAHGDPVIGGAKEKYRPSIQWAAGIAKKA